MSTESSSFVERARDLHPMLESLVERCDAERRVPDESIAALSEAGLFRMLQPKRFGGAEAHPNVFYDVVIELASACPSTAWVFGVVAVHAWQLALFPDEAQQAVWGQDPDVLICSSYMPVGKVTRTNGGFALSGTWGFSSGSDHCDWAFLGAMVPPESSDGVAEMRTFLVPKKDYAIVDDWFVSGLRGTGSKSIRVDGAFVPEVHTHRMVDGFRCSSPGNELNPSALYRIPFGQLFTRTVATPSIGMLRGAIDAYVAMNASRAGRADGKAAASDPAGQEAVARALLAFDEVRLIGRRDVDALVRYAERGQTPPLEERIRSRYHAGAVTDRMAQAIDDLFMESGGSAAFVSQRINRFFQDVHVARAHHANNPRKTGRNLGSLMLGQPTSDLFL